MCIGKESYITNSVIYYCFTDDCGIWYTGDYNISSKCMGKFKIKKWNTQFCDDRETHHSTERHIHEDEEEYDEMRQALLILAD